jgi:cbb3-type cytochrome oxidase subunit 3
MHLVDIMSHSGLALYAEVGMVLFIVAFVFILVSQFLPGVRKAMDAARQLPLQDDPTGTPEEDHRS